MWEALNELNGMSKVGAVFILAALTTCVIGCAVVVYDTARDTYEMIRKNKKTKN